MREFPWEQELEKTPPAALASTDGVSTHPVVQTSSSLAIYRKQGRRGGRGRWEHLVEVPPTLHAEIS